MNSYWNSIRSFPRSVVFYILASGMIGFAYFGITTVLNNLYLLRLGYGPNMIGLMNGAGQLCWAILALPAALVGQRISPRNALIAGTFIIALANGLFLLVELLPHTLRTGWLFGTTLLLWAGAAFNTVNGLPYLVSVTGPAVRHHALAISNASSALMAFLGSLAAGLLPGWVAGSIGATLEQAAPYRYAYGLAPVCFLLATLFYTRTSPSASVGQETETRQASPVPLAIFLFLGGVVFLQTASEGAVRVFFNIYLDTELGVPTAQIGTIFGLAALLPIVGALSMPPLVARIGTGYAFCLSGLGTVVCLIVLAAFPYPFGAALGFMGLSTVGNLAGAVRSMLSQEIVTPRWRTTSSAILILGLALGWASMALVGGALIGTLRFSGLSLLGAGSALASATLMFTYLRLRSKARATAALVLEA